MKTLFILFVVVMLSTTVFAQYSIELHQFGPGYTQRIENIIHNDSSWTIRGYLIHHPRGGYNMCASLDGEFLFMLHLYNNELFHVNFLPEYTSERYAREHLFRLYLGGTVGCGEGYAHFTRP